MFSRDTAEEDSDWIGMTAEHYAQKMLQGIKHRVGDAHKPEEDADKTEERDKLQRINQGTGGGIQNSV